MPDTMNVQVTAGLNGRNYNTDWSTTGENKAGSSPTVTPGALGTLTTRTDDNTGVITMDAAHTIVDGDLVDLYWTLLGVDYQRRNMTVGTVASLVVPIDGGSGDVLPANLTEDIVVKVAQVEGAWAVPGANVTGLCVKAPSYRGQVVIRQSGGTEIAAFNLGAGESYVWSDQSGITNPVTGATIGKVSFSHADPTNSQEMSVDFLYN